MNIPIGSFNTDTTNDHISDFHNKIVAVKNLRKLLISYPDLKFDTWVVQGGFAGDSIMSFEKVLDKFRGLETCQIFNFNGDIPGAKLALFSQNIKEKFLVSKNICHGISYDRKVHKYVENFKNNWIGLQIVFDTMEIYLKKHSGGKKFHDPLAACVAIDRNICKFREVEVYHEKTGWGSRLKEGTNTFISVDADEDRFWKTFVGGNLK